MRQVLLFVFLVSGLVAKAQEGPVAFASGDWAHTQAQAQQANKPIFLYIWSMGCGPCRTMARDVFPDPAVGSYYNTTFVNCKVDMDEDAGKALAKQYGIRALPAYLYFDAQGHLLHRSGGGKAAAALIQDGKDAFDPDKAFFKLKARYEAGERSADLLYTFSKADGIIQEETLYNQVAADYFKSQPAQELTSPKNQAYIFEAFTEFESPVTQYFLSHRATFVSRYGAAEVGRKTRQTIWWKAQQAGQHSNAAALAAVQTTIGKLMPSEAAQWQALANVIYLLGQPERDWPTYANSALAYGRKYAAQDPETSYESATYLKVFVTDKLLLKKADQLIQQAIAVDASYTNLLTRAELLHKLGDAAQAAAVARQAIAAAHKTNENAKGAAELLASLAPPAK